MMLRTSVALALVVVWSSVAEETAPPPTEPHYAETTVRIRLQADQPLVPYHHPGGPILDEQVRAFCKEQLKAEMGRKGMGRDDADPLFGLMESLWGSCRNMLREKLPAAIAASAAQPPQDL